MATPTDLYAFPGPTTVCKSQLDCYAQTFTTSPDLDPKFVEDYVQAENKLKNFLGCEEDVHVTIQSGEGMLALWGGLKSILVPGDVVVSICTGVYGYGVAEMCEKIGATVHKISLEYNEIFYSEEHTNQLKELLDTHNPKLVTIIHCETPSGTLNDIEKVGEIVKTKSNTLLYVDFVASAGSVPVNVSKNGIDIGCLGSQKCLSLPPDLSMVSVSPKAWIVIEDVNYVGYDALLPWKNVKESGYFPYTPNWRAIKALNSRLDEYGDLQTQFELHERVAQFCRDELIKLGLKLYPINGFSPSCTCVYVPDNFKDFNAWNEKLKSLGLHVAGSYGPLSGKVWRIGHMGTQATMEHISACLERVKHALSE